MKFLITILLCFCNIISFAKVWRVAKNTALHSIQQAINLAAADDSILVEKAIYKEGNIIINKPIQLIGINYPILDGESKYEIISIKSNHVLVKGFIVQHSGFATLEDPGAIKVYNKQNITIESNQLFDNFFGIYIQEGKNCIIKNNKIIAYGKEEQKIGNGIHCWKSDSLIIEGNNASGHRDGIYFEFVTNSVIWRNVAHHNIRYGLHFMFSNNDSYITDNPGIFTIDNLNACVTAFVDNPDTGDRNFDAKSKELANIFSDGQLPIRREAYDLITLMDPSNQTTYAKMIKN